MRFPLFSPAAPPAHRSAHAPVDLLLQSHAQKYEVSSSSRYFHFSGLPLSGLPCSSPVSASLPPPFAPSAAQEASLLRRSSPSQRGPASTGMLKQHPSLPAPWTTFPQDPSVCLGASMTPPRPFLDPSWLAWHPPRGLVFRHLALLQQPS